jgi:hypothetical protein
MPITLTVRDEALAGGTTHELALDFLTERITVRELIRGRVYQEVQDYNRRQAGPFQGLVQPEEAERTLNGPRLGPPRPIDWKRQFERASAAFEAGQVLILIDDRQAEALDEEFTIRPDTTVTFLRLALLVGG